MTDALITTPDKPDTGPLIVHLSGDFPDPIQPEKTPVIRRLVDLTAGHFNHQLISINRQSVPLHVLAHRVARNPARPALAIDSQPFDYGNALTYHAPPRGLYHAAMLRQLGDWLAQQYLVPGQARPVLLVGHKLGIEGIAVARAAQILSIPYALCLQGNSDLRILKSRPDLRDELGDIFHRAAMLFPFAPWALQQAEHLLGQRLGPTHMLPCPLDDDAICPPNIAADSFCSVFHLRHHRVKNMSGIAAALRRLDHAGERAHLQIIGGGGQSAWTIAQSIAAQGPGMELCGAKSSAEIAQVMNGSIAMVLPSRRESFGLVFIEALMAGCPVIYPAGAAIDGYFDDAPFALRVDATNPDAIAAAMRHARDHQAEIKQALALWQESEDAQQFRRTAIAQTFTAGLQQALVSGAS